MADIATLFLSPAGRIGRQGFLIAGAALVAIGVVAGALPFVGHLASLALLWPWACLSAKRLHDMDRSAGLIAVPLVPALAVGLLGLVAAAVPGMAFAAAGLALALGGIALLVSLSFLAWIGFTPGSRASNRFGEPAPALLSV